MAKKKQRYMPKKWKPTPLPGMRRTPEQRAAYNQWQLHKAELEAERLKVRAERLDSVRREVSKFLRPLGVPVKATANGFSVGNRQVQLTEAELKRGDPGPIVDRLVADRFLEDLERAVTAGLALDGFKLTTFRARDGVRLRDGQTSVALVKATRATLGGDAAPIQGNFLASEGAHWDALRRGLWRTSVSQVLTHLPGLASDVDRTRALNASAQIRTERSREFGHTVILRRGKTSVRFDPIPEHGTVQVPFEFRAGDAYLIGALRLRAPQDPLALAVFDRSANESVIVHAWLFALLGYAELTCVPVEAAAAKLPTEERGDRASRPSGGDRPSVGSRPVSKPQSHRGGGHRPDSALLPGSLVPTAHTRRYLTSYVAGHKRHLGVGRHPSTDARKRAKHLGIALGPNETWVRPHARGVPDDAALVFEWKTAPAVNVIP